MDRRSVLGMLGLGASAVPSIVGTTLGRQAGIPLNGPPEQYAVQKTEGWREDEYVKDEVKTISSKLGLYLSDKETVIKEFEKTAYRRLRQSPQVDPDLVAMKSYSDSAKLIIQARRNAERDYEYEVENMVERKDQLMARLKQVQKFLGI